MPLQLTQIQKNCQAINNYTFPNITVTQDSTLTGFSNWNVAAKGAKMSSDWWTGYTCYTPLQDVVMSTLKGIEDQFGSKCGECPFFFYMNRVVENGTPTPVTYRTIAERILDSRTLKDCNEIREKAIAVCDLYDRHPFGGDALGFGKDLTGFKDRLIREIMSDLENRYSSSASMSSTVEQLYKSHGLETYYVPVPPEDASNNAEMYEYLQIKVATLRNSIRHGSIVRSNGGQTDDEDLEQVFTVIKKVYRLPISTCGSH